MSSELLLDAAGRRRSPAAMPGHNAGHAPRNKGHVHPADPPTVDEIVAVMRQTPADRHGLRLRALIVVLWRGGLRIQEALSLIEIAREGVPLPVIQRQLGHYVGDRRLSPKPDRLRIEDHQHIMLDPCG
jgi:hypothetical protein